MARMKAVQVSGPGAPLEVVEREVPEPGPGQVRIKVEACGICHSDAFVVEGTFPGIAYPAVPGHEVAGHIDALGPEVTPWAVGQRVGVGWFGGHCGRCPPCRRGDFISCVDLQVPGIAYPGGYAEYMVAPADALAAIPDDLAAVDAAPLLCAGITTYNALRHSGARGGDLVAVLGVGGLGHLGLQFAAKLGFDTVAIARGPDKKELALRLGARRYLDSQAVDAAAALRELGGARVILATATSSKAMSTVIDGLGVNGKLLVVGATADPIKVTPLQLIGRRASVAGWPSGTAADSEDTLRFSVLAGVRAMIETLPLARGPEGYARMMRGEARFRVVLVPGGEEAGGAAGGPSAARVGG
jgi:alcohol dehydrogenase/propanol-preferring alcohol dehydrogenase